MTKENTMIGIIGLLLGVIIAGFVATLSVNNNHSGMMRMMGMNTNKVHQEGADHSTMPMADMSAELEGLSGDDYDKAFIEMMIAHHQGAIDMAKLSETRAKHDEIKSLSEDVITAQEKEIAEMKQWQENWNYSSGEMMEMMHGSH